VRETTDNINEVKQPGRAVAGRAWRWAAGAVLALVAGAGAVLADRPAVAVLCVLVLAAAAGVVGWLAGERRREAL
jgi:hypothetical protein